MDDRIPLIYDEIKMISDELAIVRMRDSYDLINVNTLERLLKNCSQIIAAGLDLIVADTEENNSIMYNFITRKIEKTSSSIFPVVQKHEIKDGLRVTKFILPSESGNIAEVYDTVDNKIYKRYNKVATIAMQNKKYISLDMLKKEDKCKLNWLIIMYIENNNVFRDNYMIDTEGNVEIETSVWKELENTDGQ